MRNRYIYEKMLAIVIRVVSNIPSEDKQKYELSMNRLLTCIMLQNQFPFLISLKINSILFYVKHPLLFSEGKDELEE